MFPQVSNDQGLETAPMQQLGSCTHRLRPASPAFGANEREPLTANSWAPHEAVGKKQRGLPRPTQNKGLAYGHIQAPEKKFGKGVYISPRD